ncbi:hypothetical protein [Aeromicrobium sp. IC_218]|uniref:hypothetical protein n=1 Tax=Aeromicrobium sp. IC_218 TaxID=2545468 RepID=UPI001038E28C|nr:hypothetical protein [Aeromicrobium sp. IC_218]TCI99877.1 hypothetical protein E0W78_05615 [Aeromicrobium sp. IC_218]
MTPPTLSRSDTTWRHRVPASLLWALALTVVLVAAFDSDVDVDVRPAALDSMASWTSWATYALSVGCGAVLVVPVLGFMSPRLAAAVVAATSLPCFGLLDTLDRTLLGALVVLVGLDLALRARQRRLAQRRGGSHQAVRPGRPPAAWPWVVGAATAALVAVALLAVALVLRHEDRALVERAVPLPVTVSAHDDDLDELELEDEDYWYWVSVWDASRYRHGQQVTLLVDPRHDDEPLHVVGDVDPFTGGTLVAGLAGIPAGTAAMLLAVPVARARRRRRLERRGGTLVHARATVLPRAGRLVLHDAPDERGRAAPLGTLRALRVVSGTTWLPRDGAWDVPATVVGLRDDLSAVQVVLGLPGGTVVVTSDRPVAGHSLVDVVRLTRLRDATLPGRR